MSQFYARSLTELVLKRATEQPNDPSIYTSTPDSEELLQSLTFSQVSSAVDRLAWHYSNQGLMPTAQPGEIPPQQVIAVLTSSSYNETLLEIALSKLGLSALLLSVNNSVAAVAHLCKLTKATHLIFGTRFVQEGKDAQALLAQEGYKLGLVEDKHFPLWGPDGVAAANVQSFPPVLTPEQETKRTCVILHSSGSTGFPKPVFITHFGMIANAAINQNKTGFSTLPVFHGYGHFSLFRCIYAGKPLTLFPGHLPLTSANICKVLEASPDVRQCYAVPYVIKLLGETEEGIKAMKSFDVIGYAGAALPDDLGDRLTAAGVNLLSIYGTTETGGLMNSTREFATDKLWNWVRPVDSKYIIFEDRGNNSFEVVVKDGYPPKIESNRPDKSYATKDLFVRHPERANLYKYVGRLDDTLVQTLGEKTNPVPMELCIRGNSPYVQEAIVFGVGRPQTGVLILPSDKAEGMDKDELMEKIWPVIEQANSAAPTHSRLLPEMIEFLPHGTQIPVATKMSILRPACYAKFKEIIDKIYERFEQGSVTEKVVLPRSELENLIFDSIVKVVGSTKAALLTKQVDLFSFGVDSLAATRVRNTLQQTLELNGQTLGQNVVYEHPSVEKLASFILALQKGQNLGATSGAQDDMMASMVDKWASKVSSRPTSSTPTTPPSNHVVVLTGASGSLGAHILYQLAASPEVEKIICLSRAKDHEDSMGRVKESLALRRLELPEAAEKKVESYASNANAPSLGLSEKEYEGIRSRVTDVIHNAWPVNFVLGLESYDEHVGGAVNLMNLAIQSGQPSPAAFYFSSSISSRQSGPESVCPEDFPSDPKTTVGTGYSRSKWVTEKLCERVAKEQGLKVGAFRIGQMVGDSINGVWNETEAWPLMFKSANTCGALPRTSDHPSWLPVDYAGRAIAEILLNKNAPSGAQLYHIVNPNINASWDVILDGLKEAGLKFESVEPLEWTKRLAESESDPAKNPTIKLLSFFENRYKKAAAAPAKPGMVFATDVTGKIAPSIPASPPLSKELVGKWVARWKETGFVATA
ncbi:L-aminoadipate-semialdehyde dehydrogenase [Flagelloscypha sp. PMI_526]|nr:L-aminoadipate-semialdehyde dehydrogenase [Flagelloscypha sp. PMI_526]